MTSVIVMIYSTFKEMREYAKLTQTQLAEKLGVTQQAVHNWETGKSKIPNRFIEPLSFLFDEYVETIQALNTHISKDEVYEDNTVNYKTVNNTGSFLKFCRNLLSKPNLVNGCISTSTSVFRFTKFEIDDKYKIILLHDGNENCIPIHFRDIFSVIYLDGSFNTTSFKMQISYPLFPTEEKITRKFRQEIILSFY